MISSIRNMMRTTNLEDTLPDAPRHAVAGPDTPRALHWWEIRQLEAQSCTAADWNRVHIVEPVELSLIRDTRFEGDVTFGPLRSGERPDAGIFSSRIADSTIGADVRVDRVGMMKGALIMDRATVENVASISYTPEAPCGQGTLAAVLDETGSRPVMIYAGLSAQAAVLMARMPRYSEDLFFPQTQELIDSRPLLCGVGEDAVVRDCGRLLDVSVGGETVVEGARSLVNGALVNNAGHGRASAYIGHGVDAENFIIEDGKADSGAILRNVYVGQGAHIEKGFTAHDSVFFANCSMENGEACALFAGPYTVSMHKGSLLIGCQTSFMNAGSSTNQSNHMYKLGPVHWGVLERGVKTSSNSYLMLGARIGAFSLLMGSHKTHPDSSEFPFSYLFGDAAGATVVVPAMMLKSCGLLRDELKWPTRDRRLKRRMPMHDRITFEVLNPLTVDLMLTAIGTIDTLLRLPADDDRYLRYKGMKFTRAALERAKMLYTLAIYKYLSVKLPDEGFAALEENSGEQPEPPGEWVDLAGQLVPRVLLPELYEAQSVQRREELLNEAAEQYPELEKRWIATRMGKEWRRSMEFINEAAAEFDKIVEEDRNTYREQLNMENEMLSL